MGPIIPVDQNVRLILNVRPVLIPKNDVVKNQPRGGEGAGGIPAPVLGVLKS